MDERGSSHLEEIFGTHRATNQIDLTYSFGTTVDIHRQGMQIYENIADKNEIDVKWYRQVHAGVTLLVVHTTGERATGKNELFAPERVQERSRSPHNNLYHDRQKREGSRHEDTALQACRPTL